jgi:ankyrin repeat protein
VSGHRDIGVSLLQNHADINAQDRDGKTALMLSILNGHQALLEVLLKKNADIKLKNEVKYTKIKISNRRNKT